MLQVVAGSRFLWERLGESPPGAGIETSAIAEARIAGWRARLGRRAGADDALRARLEHTGHSPETVFQRLAADVSQPAPGAPLPDWGGVLLRIARTASRLNAGECRGPPLRPDDPIPFEPLLLPAVLVGRAMLRERILRLPGFEARSAIKLLSKGALHSLERGLLAHLASFCAKPLAAEFSKRRTFGENLVLELELPDEGGRSTERYRRFVDDTLRAGLVPVLLAYPVLARLLATAVCFWVDSSADFVERLNRDRLEIERSFAAGRGPLGCVLALDPMLSDRHERGRTVIAVKFEQGLRVVYKPRSLGLHAGLNRFLDYCNRLSGLPRLQTLKVLCRDGYGFVEFAEHRPCATPDEAADFYRRAGMLLCVLHVLRATDCHHENLIASAGQPILVDVETLLHARDAAPPPETSAAGAPVPIEEHFFDSVLRTGMLPYWRFSADRRVAYDISALGSTTPQRVPRKVERWVGINTDAMRLRLVEIDFPLEENAPALAGEPLDPTAFRREIQDGFCAMYDFLLARRSELLGEDGPLQSLRGQRTRYVFRNSQVYGCVLHAALAPENLRCGVAFGIALESLGRPFVAKTAPARAAKLLAAELRALERQDIPLFCSDTCGTGLWAGDALALPDYFVQSSHDDVRDRLRGMGAEDRALQSAIVEGAFAALAARTDVAPAAAAAAQDGASLSDEELLAEAEAIGNEICARAVASGRGAVTWLGFGYVHEAERYQHQMLGERLYDGAPGVALFLAALFDATGKERFADMASSGVADLRARIRAPRDPASARSIGGALGIGAAIYALSEIGALLSDATISGDALVLAESLAPAEVMADTQLDVMGGAAGTILGLASLHRVTGSPHALRLAVLCGQRLLAAQTDGAWPTLGTIPLIGMSHGAAGIAYSLMRLHALSGEQAFLDAALRGIEYERRLFEAAGSRWPDLRPPVAGGERGGELVQWCHGAAGIGLARIGCAQVQPSPMLERDIDHALDAAARVGVGELDHLCCGNIGRIETLLVAATHRNSAQLRALARRLASQVIRRARAGGGYRLFGNLSRGIWNPGLFQGTAGIGYQWLRLRREAVRSIAIWQ